MGDFLKEHEKETVYVIINPPGSYRLASRCHCQGEALQSRTVRLFVIIRQEHEPRTHSLSHMKREEEEQGTSEREK